jgi:TonB family protein
MKPTLSFQCNENWDRMKIGMLSRFCESCQRDVIDFTKMPREEILEYLWTNRNEKVCGRIYKSQLDFHHEEILVTVEAFLKKNKNSNLAFYLLATSALLMLGCSDKEKSYLDIAMLSPASNTLQMTSGDTVVVTPPEPPPDIDTSFPDPMPFNLSYQVDDWGCFVPNDDVMVYGGLGLSHPSPSEYWTLAGLPPVMPEFEGGYDALISFMQEHVHYPEWEKHNRVEGVAVVAFIVDAEGNVTQPRIAKTIPNAKNIDAEVLRVVNLMPKWTPGQAFGKNVPVEFTLPVRFKI